jgi:hypothetical protein
MNLRTFLNAKPLFLSFIFLGISVLFSSIQMNAQCVSNESVSFSPSPVAGAYAPGTVVTICYSVDYTMGTGSWVDGFEVILGASWTNIQPLTAPVVCATAGTGAWIWQNSLTATGSGLTFGQGYYYDANLDGDGGNDDGDQGACTIGFCVQATVNDNGDLSVQVTTGGDGSMGGYTGADCTLIPFLVTPFSDNDGDGFDIGSDCNDANASIFPGASEVCDLLDNNCDGLIDEGFDGDGDGYTTCNGDCNDGDPSVYIGAVCDDGNANTGGDVIQSDCTCQGAIGDEPSNAFTADPTTGCIDITVDPTTYTISTVVPAPGCAGNSVGSENPDLWILINAPANGELFLSPQGTGDAGMAAYNYDPGSNTYTLLGCNDDGGPGLMPLLSLSGLTPGAQIYVQLWSYNPGNTLNFYFCSSDCQAALAYYMDVDADGFGDANQAPVLTCTPDANMILDGTDCNDASSTSYPGAAEFCDLLDNDCNGLVDDNCAGLVDNDGDGFTSDVDCDDNNVAINPSAIEICDGLDNNCNIEVDEFVSVEFYADLDGDGFGDSNNTIFDCSQPAGYVSNFDDCDDAVITYLDADLDGDGSSIIVGCGALTNGDCADNDASINSQATEICGNGIDENCDGIDDACSGTDADSDGFDVLIDCNDNDASVNPAAAEICGDGIDQNCSGVVDEGCTASDNDGDGFDAFTDCNDNCATIYPGAPCNDGNAETIDETIQADCTCGGGTTIVSCLGPQSITFEPAPTAGTWPTGTNVTICYTLDYGQNSGDWLDGMAITLGTGWSLATPFTAPVECNGGPGDWIWQESIAPTGGSAYPAGQGYYYDYNNDGDGGNDWGDAGSCVMSMCVTATTVSDIDLTVTVASGGDSQFGSYGSTAGCPIEPFIVDPLTLPACSISFPFCATPSACDPITNQYTLVQAQNNYINTSLAPASGTLDLYMDGNIIQTWNAPFNSSIAINATGLNSDGATHTLMGVFSGNPGCMGTTTFVAPAFCAGQDDDADGFVAADDCNDQDATVNPGAPEICDLQDNNCDGVIDENQDADFDGYTSCDGDCNDADPTVWIGATCDDGDPTTTNDLIQADCSCIGVLGDEPSNAFSADPATGCIDITVDPTSYTISTVVAAPGCAGNTVGSENPDVWVLINAPANGELFLSPQGTGDAGMAAYNYDAATNTFTLLGCDDDTGPGLMPQLTLTGLTPGAPIYIQLWAYNPGNTINFNFCASDCSTALTYYPDLDADTYGDATATPVLTCTPDPTWVTNNTDCNDASATAFPGGTEVCGDNIDNNCDGAIDEGCTTDIDGDGFVTADDCDDNNVAVYPGAAEVCDLVDNNCDAVIDEGFDLDGDGYTSCNGDCNDNDNTIWIGAFCNDGNPATGGDQIQSDCTCLGYISSPGDEPWTAFTADPTTGCISVTIDPALYTPSPNPGGPGCANNPSWQGVQQSDAWFAIAVPSSGVLLLNPQGTVDAGMAAYTYDPVTGVYGLIACDDDTGPGLMPEITVTTVPAGDTVFVQLWAYGGGLIDFSLCSSECTDPIAYYTDADGDGFGDNATAVFLCTPDPLLVTDNTDCNDADVAINTAASEVCDDLIDNNCDGQADEGCTTDADGDGDVDAVDCAPYNASINSLATEVCNTIDDNCDDLIDNGLPTTTYYLDADNDTFGGATSIESCYDPNSPPVCLYTFNLTDTYGDGWNGNQMQLTSNGGANIDATIGVNFTTGTGMQETVLLTNNTAYDLTWTVVGAFTGEVGFDVLSSVGDIVYSLPSGSGGSAGTYLTSFTAACPALGVYVTNSSDCNDADATANPNGVEICDNAIDEDCNGIVDVCNPVDGDGDGFFTPADCDDTNASINPSAAEICGNNIDEDCSGADLACTGTDADGDGFDVPADCDDNNASINPSATEICGNNIDEDCSGADLACTGTDADADGFDAALDCDDNNAAINPSASEICNDIDDNCNVQIDEGLTFIDYFTDGDADGYGDANAIAVTACLAPAGMVADNSDCDDTNQDIYPGAQEICNDGFDNNCNGTVDETTGSSWYVDTDSDGFGDAIGTLVACDQPTGYVLNSSDCNDNNASINPSATEVCGNSIDEDCDGIDDTCPALDVDGDGFSSPIDCNDNNASIYPGATEVCFDNQDNNCNGVVDEGCVSNVDADGDGFVAGYDCNDNNPSINPAGAESCNLLDDDCDGIVDDSTGVELFYQDADGDLLGNINAPFTFCVQPANGWVTNSLDCNDADASLFGPGSPCDNGSVADSIDTYQLDCSCQGLILGCTDPQACNYDENAMFDDGSCESSSYIPGAIDGDDFVDTYSYHNYSYTGDLTGVTLLWTLNSPGIFIPVSNTASTPAVNVYWSEGNSFDPQGEITLVVTDTTGGCNAQFEITFNVEFDTTTTDVNEALTQKVLAWPNPSNGNFAVVVPEEISNGYDVMIYSVTGELVYNAGHQSGKIWNAQLDLASGLYKMKIVGDRDQYLINVVIED